MKKLFTLMFLLSAIGSAVYAENLIDSKDMRDEISKTVKTEVADNQGAKIKATNDYDIAGSFVNVIFFRQDIVTESGKSVSNDNKDCVAVAIDDAWAVASKKCRLSQGDKIAPLPGTVKNVSTSNFRIVINDRAYKVDAYETKNLLLLRAVNENENPLFSLDFKPKLAYAYELDFEDGRFNKGFFEVNRTNIHKAAYDDSHDVYEDNFHPYYKVGRKTYKKEVKSVHENNTTKNIYAKISTSWIGGKELRAGDPLFYVQDGRRYLLGFGNATNLWDNFSNTRTDNVLLFTYSDIADIVNRIESIDPAAKNRIWKNILK